MHACMCAIHAYLVATLPPTPPQPTHPDTCGLQSEEEESEEEEEEEEEEDDDEPLPDGVERPKKEKKKKKKKKKGANSGVSEQDLEKEIIEQRRVIEASCPPCPAFNGRLSLILPLSFLYDGHII